MTLLFRLGRQARRVLGAYAQSRCTKEIAAELGISPKTVEFHRSQIVRHLGSSDVAFMTRVALIGGEIPARVMQNLRPSDLRGLAH